MSGGFSKFCAEEAHLQYTACSGTLDSMIQTGRFEGRKDATFEGESG